MFVQRFLSPGRRENTNILGRLLLLQPFGGVGLARVTKRKHISSNRKAPQSPIKKQKNDQITLKAGQHLGTFS